MREEVRVGGRPDTPGRATAARPLPVTLARSIVLRFIGLGLNALTGIITARALDPTGRGELAAMILWPMLLAGVTTLGVPSALIYHVRRKPDQTAALVGGALTMSVATGIAATILGWFLVPLWLRNQPAAIVHAAQYCLLSTAISSLTLTSRAAWEAKGYFGLSNLSQLIAPLTIILALVPQAELGILTPRSAAATYVLAGFPVVIWSLLSVFRACRPTLQGMAGAWRDLLHFGSRSCGIDLCGVLAMYLDQALVVGLLSPASMGIYVVALSLSRVINAIQSSAATMVFPKVVGLATIDLGIVIARSARLSAVVSGAAGLLIAGFGGTLVTWLYGASYASAGRILPLLVCNVVLGGVVQMLLQGFLAAGRPGIATLIQLSGLSLSIPLFLVLVPPFGTLGAAGALCSATAIRLLLAVCAYPAFLQVPIPRVWIGPKDLVDLATYRWVLAHSFSRFRTGEAG